MTNQHILDLQNCITTLQAILHELLGDVDSPAAAALGKSMWAAKRQEELMAQVDSRPNFSGRIPWHIVEPLMFRYAWKGYNLPQTFEFLLEDGLVKERDLENFKVTGSRKLRAEKKRLEQLGPPHIQRGRVSKKKI